MSRRSALLLTAALVAAPPPVVVAAASAQAPAAAAPVAAGGAWTTATYPAPAAPGGSAGLLGLRGGARVAWWSSGTRTLGTSSAGTTFLGLGADGRERRRTSVAEVPVGDPVVVGREARLLTSVPNRFGDLRGLSLRVLSATGRLGAPVALGGETLVVAAGIAGDAQGDLVVAWLESVRNPAAEARNGVRLTLKVRKKRPGGKLSPERIVATLASVGPPDGDLAVAVTGLNGRYLVAYGDPGADATNDELAAGGTWHARRTAQVRAWLGSTRTAVDRTKAYAVAPFRGSVRTAAGFSPDGHAVLAWGNQRHGEEAGSPWVVREATLGLHASAAFSAPHVVDRGAAREFPASGLRMVSSGGVPVLFWGNVSAVPGSKEAAYPLYGAAASASGRFGAPVLFGTDATLGRVAVGASGGVAMTAGLRSGAGEAPLVGALGLPSPPSRLPEPLSAFAVERFAAPAIGDSLPAVDRDGRTSVAWIDGGSATDGPRLVVATARPR